MSYKLKREHPFTKQVAVYKFIVNKANDGTPFTQLKTELQSLFEKNLDVPPIKITEHLSIKCRNIHTHNDKLLVFLSWYEDILDIPTTKIGAKDEINEESVENADICHLFISVKDNIIWAFATLSSQQIHSKVTKVLTSLLPYNQLKVSFDVDNDYAATIMNEKVKHIAIESSIDMCALGFPKRNFISRLLRKEVSSQDIQPFGTLIIDNSSNVKVINEIENHPNVALEYIAEDEENLDKNIYIVTKKNRKIDGESLKKRKLFYLMPYGKTKTVSWADAKNLLSENFD